tara:strand:+ start:751 stop:1080 length:330 start_codon:yes stop_codon:yes gene_type:complete
MEMIYLPKELWWEIKSYAFSDKYWRIKFRPILQNICQISSKRKKRGTYARFVGENIGYLVKHEEILYRRLKFCNERPDDFPTFIGERVGLSREMTVSLTKRLQWNILEE